MQTLILIFLVALAITGFGTPWVRKMALALDFVDAPAERKLHGTPMPLLGGVAIFGGAIIVLAVVFWGNPDIIGVLLAATMIAVVGLVDDHRPLPAWVKFGGQALAFVVAIALGAQVRLPVAPPINYMLAFLWLAVITNAVNFLDNMDGLAAGISAVAAAYIVLLASFNDQYVIAPMAAAMLGACLGFLRYNFNPARIFMGDTGSLMLGFLLAVMTLQLRFPANSNFVTWMVPVFILGVPLFDLSLVTFSRVRRRVNPLTTAGKDHTSHRLVRLGFTQREAVLLLYLLGGAFGMVALFITQATVTEGYLIGLATMVLAVFAIWWLDANANPFRPKTEP